MTRRIWITGALGALLLGLALLFWSDVFSGFLEPSARAVWLLLRLSILSVDQALLWALGILVAVLFLVIRLAQSLGTDQTPAAPPEDRLPREAERWVSLFDSLTPEVRFDRTLQRELVWTLVSVYTLKHRIPAGFEVADAFRQRRLPLPESVYGLLFEGPPPWRPFPWSLFSLPLVPRSRAHRQATARRNLNLVLTYLEQTLEAHDV